MAQTLKVCELYIQTLKTAGGFGAAVSLYSKTLELYAAKKISIAMIRDALHLLMTPSGDWLKFGVTVFLGVIERVEMDAPGELQPELRWLSERLETLEPEELPRKELRARIDKILKPIFRGDFARPNSVNRSLAKPIGSRCSRLARHE
jgi:hypothetical protein